ncbi:hypothetical protein RclHR1_00060020 [Rhizophagus clarus]|nr:hypothetical protein RclHR1_00060020 [Rhizophagus clarus]
MNTFPLNKRIIQSDNLSNVDDTYFRVKCEKYKILFNKDDVKASKEFNQAIENALESMKPFTHLQDVFNECDHFSSSDSSERIDIKSPTFNLLGSYLEKFNISNLLTQEGNIIEKET